MVSIQASYMSSVCKVFGKKDDDTGPFSLAIVRVLSVGRHRVVLLILVLFLPPLSFLLSSLVRQRGSTVDAMGRRGAGRQTAVGLRVTRHLTNLSGGLSQQLFLQGNDFILAG